MTAPMNPNTLLPMSLQVDKIQQAKQLHPAQQQGLVSQQLEQQKQEQKNRVNANQETEYARVEEDQSRGNTGHGEAETNNEQGEKEQEVKKKGTSGRGSYVDIKV